MSPEQFLCSRLSTSATTGVVLRSFIYKSHFSCIAVAGVTRRVLHLYSRLDTLDVGGVPPRLKFYKSQAAPLFLLGELWIQELLLNVGSLHLPAKE